MSQEELLLTKLPGKLPSKKAQATASIKIKALFREAGLPEEKWAYMFARLPAAIFEDCTGQKDPKEAEDIIFRFLSSGDPRCEQEISHAILGLCSRQSFAPENSPQPKRPEKDREEGRKRTGVCQGCGEFPRQCVCSLFVRKKKAPPRPPEDDEEESNTAEETEEDEEDEQEEDDRETETEDPQKENKLPKNFSVENPRFLLDGRFWPLLARKFSTSDVERALANYVGYAPVFATFPADAAFLKDILREQFLLLQTFPAEKTAHHAISTIDRAISRFEFFAARKRSVVEGAAVENELCSRTLPPHLRKARRTARKEATQNPKEKDNGGHDAKNRRARPQPKAKRGPLNQ